VPRYAQMVCVVSGVAVNVLRKLSVTGTCTTRWNPPSFRALRY
jgi:hypothetical protein